MSKRIPKPVVSVYRWVRKSKEGDDIDLMA